ncbi:hypothetical protein MN608_08084 [Microdochium nivale]|nr:hypothetical protein MN608_08084 [Microdochium nivale]
MGLARYRPWEDVYRRNTASCIALQDLILILVLSCRGVTDDIKAPHKITDILCVVQRSEYLDGPSERAPRLSGQINRNHSQPMSRHPRSLLFNVPACYNFICRPDSRDPMYTQDLHKRTLSGTKILGYY